MFTQRAHLADEYAPAHLKSVWLAIFLMAIPVGYAIGYIYGAAVGILLGWRGAFMSAACLMLPFTVFAFHTKPVPLGKAAIAGHGSNDRGRSAPPQPRNGHRPYGPPVHSDTIEDAEALAAAAAAAGDAGDAAVAALGDAEKLLLLEAAMERSDAARHRPGVRGDKANAWGGSGDAHAIGSGEDEAAHHSQGLLGADVPTDNTPMRRQTLWLIQCAPFAAHPCCDACRGKCATFIHFIWLVRHRQHLRLVPPVLTHPHAGILSVSSAHGHKTPSQKHPLKGDLLSPPHGIAQQTISAPAQHTAPRLAHSPTAAHSLPHIIPTNGTHMLQTRPPALDLAPPGALHCHGCLVLSPCSHCPSHSDAVVLFRTCD